MKKIGTRKIKSQIEKKKNLLATFAACIIKVEILLFCF